MGRGAVVMCSVRVRVATVLNARSHLRAVQKLGLEPAPSKYPPAFGIDLHVDDSPGVALEGERFGFNLLVVQPDDADWAAKVLECVESLRAGMARGVATVHQQ